MFCGLGAFLGTMEITPFRVKGTDSAVRNFGCTGVSIMVSFEWYVEKDFAEAAILPFDTPLE